MCVRARVCLELRCVQSPSSGWCLFTYRNIGIMSAWFPRKPLLEKKGTGVPKTGSRRVCVYCTGILGILYSWHSLKDRASLPLSGPLSADTLTLLLFNRCFPHIWCVNLSASTHISLTLDINRPCPLPHPPPPYAPRRSYEDVTFSLKMLRVLSLPKGGFLDQKLLTIHPKNKTKQKISKILILGTLATRYP